MALKFEIKKKEKVNCSGCDEEMSVTHGGIACSQGYHFCLNGCAAQFVQMIFYNMSNNFSDAKKLQTSDKSVKA